MLKSLQLAYNLILKAIKLLIVVFASLLVIIVFSNIICRYFLHFSLAWAEESARFIFIWLAFTGAVLGNANNEHMKFDLLVDKMPGKIRALVLMLAYGIIIFILALLIYGGVIIVKINAEWLTPVLGIPYGLIYTIVPICGTLLILQVTMRFFSAFNIIVSSNKNR